MGAILNKFNQYIKWGASKFTDNFDVLASTKDGSDGIQTHLYEIRKKTGEAISSLETSVDGKVQNNGGNGYSTGAELKAKIVLAQNTARSGVSNAASAKSRADSAYSLASGKMTQGTADGRYLKLSGGANSSVRINVGGFVKFHDVLVDTISSNGSVDAKYGDFYTTLNSNGDAYFKNLTVDGKFTNNSDINLKEKIKKEVNSLEKISKINGYNYNFKADNKKRLYSGVIAQEVEKVFPHMVTISKKTGLKSVSYTELIAPMIEAIKELNDKIESQQKEIEKLSK